jgi:integrase
MKTAKGINASDYLNFDTALNTGIKLLNDNKKQKIGLYILTSIYTGLRTGDIQNLTWEMLKNESFTIIEEKTGKARTIQVHQNLRKAINKICEDKSGMIFLSQKKTVYSTQALNRVLKDVFSKQARTENISTHSLRKTFGRRVYDMQNQSEHALTLLSQMFGHSNIQITRIYLGLKQEEFNSIYLSL